MADSAEHHASSPSHEESDSPPHLKANPYKELRPQLGGNTADVLADLNSESNEPAEESDTPDQ